MCISRVGVLAVAVGGLFSVGPASGTMVTFTFSGRITDIVDNGHVLGTDVVVGDTFTGTYTFSSALTDSLPYPDEAEYRSPSSVMHVTVGAFDLFGGTSNLIRVQNLSAHDGLSLSSSGFVSDGLDVSGMVAYLYDHTSAVFSTDALPLLAPPLAAFDTARFGVEGHRVQGDAVGFSFGGAIDHFAPEPGSLALLLLGLTGVRRSRRVG